MNRYVLTVGTVAEARQGSRSGRCSAAVRSRSRRHVTVWRHLCIRCRRVNRQLRLL